MSSGFTDWFTELARAFAHGVTQGGLAEAAGGDFGSGFLGAFAGSLAGTAMASPKGVKHFGKPKDGNARLMVRRTVAAAVVGGTVAEIGGGKFANGATSAAMVHLFNHEHQDGDVKDIEVLSVDVTVGGLTTEEWLLQTGVPMSVISGVVAATTVPISGLTGSNNAEVAEGVTQDVVSYVTGAAVGMPDEFETIEGLTGKVKELWNLREVRRMANNAEIRVSLRWKVYHKRTFWFDTWETKTGKFPYNTGHRGQIRPGDYRKAIDDAKGKILK